MLLRVVAVLACAAYAAAVQCAECVGMIEGYNLDTYGVCHRELGGTEMLTQCEYAQPGSPVGYVCEYNDAGENVVGGWALCPESVDIGNVYNNCPPCDS